jgi:hypothetical protein
VIALKAVTYPTGIDYCTYVLCEINVSSVSPFPDPAVALVAQATLARARVARRSGG